MASCDDRDVLLVLYRSTGGDSWRRKDKWNTGADLDTRWFGVPDVDHGRVVKLDMPANNIQGRIPAELGDLKKLEVLSLGGNKFVGSIPPELAKCTALRVLSLSMCELNGSIPPEVGKLKALMRLEIVDNKLSGSIPPELGNLSALTFLDLAGNQLSGHIPKELGALTKLQRLMLTGNQLTGTVPLGIWKLPRAERVDLGDNLLTQFTDPNEKTASTEEVLKSLERVERMEATREFAAGCYVNTDGNPWEFPPAAVAVKGRKSIRRYYDTWKQCDFGLVEIDALKVVFVGAQGAGKTSLARSIRKGRGDRTPEGDENMRTTVGVDLFTHSLRNGTECKVYDVAGQISYYGLHQYFLTERAVYVIVWDATRFEGLSGRDLDQAIEDNILEWVSLLHMRTPVCTVMLVASHCDLLVGSTPEDNHQFLEAVEKRFLELHATWKSLRRNRNAHMDQRMNILPGVFPVSCKLESESASGATADDGLQAVEETLSQQASMTSRVPPSWIAARKILEGAKSVNEDTLDESASAAGRRLPWELRSNLHNAFKEHIHESRNTHHAERWLSRLKDVGIRDSMEGAIEMRAFSGTLISRDNFVVLDVSWLAGVLKPVLDHRGIIENSKGRPAYSNRVLATAELHSWAEDLVDRGILRTGFARVLWNMDGGGAMHRDDPREMEPAEFEKILEDIGIAIPLPAFGDERAGSPAAAELTSPGGESNEGPCRDGVDLLVVMRLDLEADGETLGRLQSARQTAFRDSSGGESFGLKAVFKFDHAGAPHGLPERVIALTHKIGVFSPRARWRLGGLFVLHEKGGTSGPSYMILEYNKRRTTFVIEALGQTAVHFEAIRFVISALFHVAKDFPGVCWTGWVECGMSHDGQKMCFLSSSDEKQNHRPGSWIIPHVRSSQSGGWKKQRNGCGTQGMDPRGSCTLDPSEFGKVMAIKPIARENSAAEYGDASNPSHCREACEYVFKPASGKIASTFLGFFAAFFIAATAIDDDKGAVLGVCYGFAALSLLVALVAAGFFVKLKVEEGRRTAHRADPGGSSPPHP